MAQISEACIIPRTVIMVFDHYGMQTLGFEKKKFSEELDFPVIFLWTPEAIWNHRWGVSSRTKLFLLEFGLPISSWMIERKSFILSCYVLYILKVPFPFQSPSLELENYLIYVVKYHLNCYYFRNRPGYKSCPEELRGLEFCF